MDKKIVGGLLAVLFIAQAAQVGAISNLEKSVSKMTAINSQKSVAMNNYNAQSQVAAVTLATNIPNSPDPGPAGYFLYLGSDGIVRCGYSDISTGVLYLGGQTNGSPYGNPNAPYNSEGCTGAHPAINLITGGSSSNSSGNLNITLSSGKDSYTISGDPIPVMQFKLFTLGFLDVQNITGKLDTITKKAVIVYQKTTGLSQTGVYDSKTQKSLNSFVPDVMSVNDLKSLFQNQIVWSSGEGSPGLPFLRHIWCNVTGGQWTSVTITGPDGSIVAHGGYCSHSDINPVNL